MLNQILVVDRASEQLAAALAQYPLPERREVPLSELGCSVGSFRPSRTVVDDGWRGFFFGKQVEEVGQPIFFIVTPDDRKIGRYDEAPTFLAVGFEYAVRNGTELWAVPVGYTPGIVDQLAVKLADLPEEVMAADDILPPQWTTRTWATCGCGEGGWFGKIMFESEVKEYLRTWLADHGG